MGRDVIRIPMFWAVSTASGLLGLSISFTSMWFLKQTGPTTYRWSSEVKFNIIFSAAICVPPVAKMEVDLCSLVGSLNKIPISLAGIFLFKVPVSVPNLFSILFGELFRIFPPTSFSTYYEIFVMWICFSSRLNLHQVYLLGYSLQRQKCPDQCCKQRRPDPCAISCITADKWSESAHYRIVYIICQLGSRLKQIIWFSPWPL